MCRVRIVTVAILFAALASIAQARRKDPDYANSADDPKLRSGISNPALVFDRFNY